MDDFNTLFDHLPHYRVILCRKCHFAPIPHQVETHLGSFHRYLSSEQRQVITREILSLSNLAHVEADVIYPQPGSAPVPGLPAYYDGLCCRAKDAGGVECRYLCRTARGMREHCKKRHGWVNEQKRGGNARIKQSHSSNRLWSCNHACQRFFKVGSWQRYFEVVATSSAEKSPATDVLRRSFFRQQEEEVRQMEQDAIKAVNVVEGFDSHRSAAIPWLNTTGIVDHVRGLKKDEIRPQLPYPLVRMIPSSKLSWQRWIPCCMKRTSGASMDRTAC